MAKLEGDIRDRVIVFNPNSAMGWDYPGMRRAWMRAGYSRGAANFEDLRHEFRRYLEGEEV